MKIAVSGTHRTGKTTLVAALAELLPTFSVVEEPYHQLVEEGHVFLEMPSLDDFELQLKCSIESIQESEEDCIFDRCPLDMLAYLTTHKESDAFDIKSWLPVVEAAVRKLDLIVLLRIEESVKSVDSDSGNDDFRHRADEAFAEIILEDRWKFGVLVIEVTGSTEERLRQIEAEVNLG